MENQSSSDTTSSTYRRWYDYDQNLIEVLDLLRAFQEDVRAQAEVFLDKIEGAVGKEVLEQFYAASPPPPKRGNRWYDHDPVIYKAVELLRVLPPDAQQKAALHFLDSLKKQGITKEVLQQTSTGS